MEALKGWNEHPDIYGPDYIPSASLEKTIFHVLESNAAISEIAVDAMATRKTRAMNLHALLLGRPLYDPMKIREEAEDFLVALDEASNVLDHDFSRRFGFTRAELSVLHRFMSKTASILYEMGFPDAVRHATQVSRLCVIQAARLGASKPELLQAAMVGWLHDPKLASELSWENLATHPVIGSAIADHVFSDPEFNRELEAVLQDNRFEVKDFTRGVCEALSINNDSKFILTEVILKTLDPQVSQAEEFREVVLQRFMAPMKNTPPPLLSGELKSELARGEVATGLRGLSMSLFKAILKRLSPEFPEISTSPSAEVLELLLENGQIPGLSPEKRSRFLQAVQEALKNAPEALVEHKIRLDSLFSHHSEVENGDMAALALASSDPLMLSPHKIIEAERGSCLSGIQAFLKSYNDNVTYVPWASRAGALEWQKDLYLGMLTAASELTGKEMDLPPSFKQAPLEAKIEMLTELLSSPSSWQAADGIDYGSASLNDPGTRIHAEQLLVALKRHYDQAAETSPALFGAAPLQTSR